ncbi:MAG: ABC transporter permease [Verrucomicrobia bacterium]|jgi:phospholipid/cholesterol/gamma-HCH transport system permease protein|nr:MAG: ABC transporter permease [Verrucomicrobiota bacterium]
MQESETTMLIAQQLRSGLSRLYADLLGRRVFKFLLALHGVGAFALITFGVMLGKFSVARCVVRPLVAREISRAGVKLLPMFLFASLAMGFLIIGQAAPWVSRVGGENTFLGDIMAIVVVRELGPLLTAFLVLARVGTANVVELGTARAMGEVESLEALGIDPVHYFVMPRVIGMAVGIFSLTVYLILGTVGSGYLWAFVQHVPLQPSDYFNQLAGALSYLDFILLALKTCAFGCIIAIVTCYHGLAQPLQLDQISNATVRAVGQSVIACVLIDALFIIAYLTV